MDNLNNEILQDNQILSKKCLVYKKALMLAIEGLKNINNYNTHANVIDLTKQTMKEIDRILDNK